MEFDY